MASHDRMAGGKPVALPDRATRSQTEGLRTRRFWTLVGMLLFRCRSAVVVTLPVEMLLIVVTVTSLRALANLVTVEEIERVPCWLGVV